MSAPQQSPSSSIAYCTLVTNDAYVTAALVLAKSLRDTGTSIPIVVIITPETVSQRSVQRLRALFDDVVPVQPLGGDSARNRANLALIGRPDLATTLTKLHLWSLTRFRQVLYLDADTLALRSLDHLLLRPPFCDLAFAASPELGFPDCFNSGVMLLRPDDGTHAVLLRLAAKSASFDGGDQGLLNQFFGDGTRGHPAEVALRLGSAATGPGTDEGSTSSGADSDSADSGVVVGNGSSGGKEQQRAKKAMGETAGSSTTAAASAGSSTSWYRLSYMYNMEMHKVYRMYIPAVLRYRDEHKVLHFIGKDKPWHFADGAVEGDGSPYYRFYAEMVGRWWQVRKTLPREAEEA